MNGLVAKIIYIETNLGAYRNAPDDLSAFFRNCAHPTFG